MTDHNQTEDAREAEDMGEKPDTGRKPDALTDALSGSGMGSDTTAGSLQGGAASGSEIDPDQDAVNESLTRKGVTASDAPGPVDPEPVNNTGSDRGDQTGSRRGETDAATG